MANVLLMTYNMGNVPGRYKLEEGATTRRAARKWSAPWGWMTSAMMQHAFVFMQYCTKYGGSHDDLAPFVLNQRRNGLLTPWGYYAQHEPYQITLEDYLTQRYICWPNGLLDSDRPVNHAFAMIFATAERAKDMKQKPIYVLSHVQASHPTQDPPWPRWKTTRSGPTAWPAGCTRAREREPEDLDIFNPYDGFATVHAELPGRRSSGTASSAARHSTSTPATFEWRGLTPSTPAAATWAAAARAQPCTRTASSSSAAPRATRQVTVRAETAAMGQVTPGGNGHIFLSVHPQI